MGGCASPEFIRGSEEVLAQLDADFLELNNLNFLNQNGQAVMFHALNQGERSLLAGEEILTIAHIWLELPCLGRFRSDQAAFHTFWAADIRLLSAVAQTLKDSPLLNVSREMSIWCLKCSAEIIDSHPAF